MLFLLSLLVGCSDISLGKIELRESEILVHPTHIDFGNLISGFESDQKSFTVINTGDDDLVITSPFLLSDDDRFKIDSSDGEEITVGAGELIEFSIVYTPETYEHNEGTIAFHSSDDDESDLYVTLEGRGDAPVMTVDPIDFNYGDISIGCDNEERITITNDGNLPLVVDSVVQMVTQPVDIILEFGSMPELPWVLDPETSVDFLVSYIPEDIGADNSSITITGNDPMTPVVESIQYGSGDVEQYYTETHIQSEIHVLDILWVIDDSGSMNRVQASLSSNMQMFMDVFANSQADYRMSVITTSDPMIYQAIDSSHPDATLAMQSLVSVGTHGSGVEMGLEMAYQALSDSNSAGPGGSFFRDQADLVVIFISDEPDFSYQPINIYNNFFANLKPAGMFIPYAVIGDMPNGCTAIWPNGQYNVQPGTGYWDVVNYFSSDWFSICASDWGNQLQNLATNITGRWNYPLNESDPIESSIEVRVNGQIVSDWIYVQSDNSVEFDSDSIPRPGDTIEITYSVWGCYE
jgi:hypothetical protein